MMTMQEKAIDTMNRVLSNIESGDSPFVGMRIVTANDIKTMWPQYKTDMSNMFKDCTNLVEVNMPGDTV